MFILYSCSENQKDAWILDQLFNFFTNNYILLSNLLSEQGERQRKTSKNQTKLSTIKLVLGFLFILHYIDFFVL